MTDTDTFIEDFLEHKKAYDPVYAREYYLRTRKLKGRKPARKLEEDEAPPQSPNGARITDFSNGRATYADGSYFDKDGWRTNFNQGKSRRNTEDSEAGPNQNRRSKSNDDSWNEDRQERANQMQDKLNKARQAAKKAPPAKRNALQKKIDKIEGELQKVRNFGKAIGDVKLTRTKDRSGKVRQINKRSVEDEERILAAKDRLDRARAAAKRASPEKKNRLEKNIDRLENEYKKQYKKIKKLKLGNPFS